MQDAGDLAQLDRFVDITASQQDKPGRRQLTLGRNDVAYFVCQAARTDVGIGEQPVGQPAADHRVGRVVRLVLVSAQDREQIAFERQYGMLDEA